MSAPAVLSNSRCSVCGWVSDPEHALPHWQQLMHHMEGHEREQCDHRRGGTTAKIVLQCSTCGLVMAHLGELLAHNKRAHRRQPMRLERD